MISTTYSYWNITRTHRRVKRDIGVGQDDCACRQSDGAEGRFMNKNSEEIKCILKCFWFDLGRPFAVAWACATGCFVALLIFLTIAPWFMQHCK